MAAACFRARVWCFVYMVLVHCSWLYVMHGITPFFTLKMEVFMAAEAVR